MGWPTFWVARGASLWGIRLSDLSQLAETRFWMRYVKEVPNRRLLIHNLPQSISSAHPYIRTGIQTDRKGFYVIIALLVR
jgi:hypothetical protein